MDERGGKLNQRAGEETAAFREAADRLDGKVPHAVVGDEDHPAVVENVTDPDIARAIAFILRKHMTEDGSDQQPQSADLRAHT